jgi:hypothetical protein
MNKTRCLQFVAALALALSLLSPAWGQGDEARGPRACEGPAAEAIVFDALVLRPIGLASMVVGFAGALVAYPFALLSHSADRVTQKLIVEPFEYTFKRPVGDEDYKYCGD